MDFSFEDIKSEPEFTHVDIASFTRYSPTYMGIYYPWLVPYSNKISNKAKLQSFLVGRGRDKVVLAVF